MRERGLAIEGGSADLHLPRVNVVDDPAQIGIVDLVLFAVKLWDTEAAIDQIRPIVGPNTTVVSFQNGVLKDDYMVRAFGAQRVMGGVCYVATAIARPWRHRPHRSARAHGVWRIRRYVVIARAAIS